MKTRITLMLLFAIAFGTQTQAQSVVRFSPLSLIKNKAKFHYEYGGFNKMGLGVIASGFYGAYPGFRVEPYFRYYITDESLNGLYVQPKFHTSINTYETSITVNGETVTEDHNINESGGSLALGYQKLFGANENIVFDFFIGYRYSTLHSRNWDTTAEEEGGDDVVGDFAYMLLHSNKLDLGISVGFKF